MRLFSVDWGKATLVRGLVQQTMLSAPFFTPAETKILVLLSASVERFCVSHMRDFLLKTCFFGENIFFGETMIGGENKILVKMCFFGENVLFGENMFFGGNMF